LNFFTPLTTNIARSRKLPIDEDAPPNRSMLDDIRDKRKIESDTSSNKRIKRDIDSQMHDDVFSDEEESDAEEESNEEPLYNNIFENVFDTPINDDQELKQDEKQIDDEEAEDIGFGEFDKLEGEESDDEEVQLGDLIESVKRQHRNEESRGDLSALHQLNATQHYVAPTSTASLERATAYDMLKNDLKKWEPITNYLETARTIPVIYMEGRGRSGGVKNGLKKKGKFEQALEKKLHLDDDKTGIIPLFEYDESTPNIERLSKQELIARNREIAQKRLQLSYQQQKQARLKKIKSKIYRKILKRQKQREAEAEEQELERLDPEEAQAKVLEREKDYIKERVTLRHKNSSQWVRQAMRSGTAHYNKDVSLSVAEQLRIGDELRKKQTRVLDDSEEIADKLMDGESEILEKLREEVIEEEGTEKKGLQNMKFMKKAREKRLLQSLDLIDQLEKEIRGDEEYNVSTITGRMTFAGKQRSGPENKIDGNINIVKQAAVVSVKEHVTVEEVPSVQQSTKVDRFNLTKKNKNQANLTPIPEELKQEKKTTIKVTSVTLSGNNKRKRIPDANDDNNPWLNLSNEKKESRMSKRQKKDESNDEGELKVHEISATIAAPTSSSIFDQVKRQAFASDNLSLQFESEKKKAVESEIQLPDMESATLPGWGQWVGKGTNWKKDVERKKKNIERIRKKIIDQKVSERPDNEIGHVIIRETAKVPDKYLNKNVSHDEVLSKVHDRTLSHPLGPEWNSLTGHLEATQPRIKTKRGTRIAPLSYDDARREVQYRRIGEIREIDGDASRNQIEKALEKPITKVELQEPKSKKKKDIHKDSKLKEERNRIITSIDHNVDVLVDR
jgi:U3 small nucleolar RNA-associated protein 14